MIMSNLSTGKIDPKTNTSGTGSYLSEMLFIALNRSLPEQVEAATEHALGITKIGKSKNFGTPAVRATPVWSPPRDIFKSSGGGIPTFGVLATKNRGSKTPLSKKAHQKAHPTPTKHPVPTQLAEIWEQLDRAERRKLEQVISEMQDRK